MTMIEQVAHALWLEDANRAAPKVAKYRTQDAFKNVFNPGEQRAWIGLAIAAITAMREPTDQMGNALNRMGRPYDAGSHSATEIWQALIDAALEEGE